MKYYSKSNNAIVIGVAVFLLLTSYLIYHFYFKDFGEYNKQDEKESIYIDVVDQDVINDVIATIIDNNLIEIAKLEKNIESINTIDNSTKLNLIYKSFKNKEEITTEEINNYLNNTFLDTIYYDKVDIYCNNKIFYNYKEDKYIKDEEVFCDDNIYNIYTNVSLKKKSNTYILTLSYLWSRDDKYYYTYKDVINDNNYFKVEKDKELEDNYNEIKNYLHEYTYIFEKYNDNYLISGFKYK